MNLRASCLKGVPQQSLKKAIIYGSKLSFENIWPVGNADYGLINSLISLAEFRIQRLFRDVQAISRLVLAHS